jgi:hypothetical protein
VADPAWPSDLPQLPQLPVTLGFEDGVLRSENDVGPAKTRILTTATPHPMQFRLPMNRAELDSFHLFWKHAVKGRALPFTHHWPLTRETATMRFTTLPGARALGADNWEVELSVEVLP